MEIEERAQQIRTEIQELKSLVARAEAEGTLNALAAKALFLQVIDRLKLQLAQAEKGDG